MERGMLSVIGADFALEHFNRAGLGAESFVIPALDGRKPEQNPFLRNRVAPLFGGQFLELGLQLASGRRRSQKRSDDAEPKMGPAFMRPQDRRCVFHRMSLFLFFPPVRWCGQGFTPAFPPMSPGILCGTKILPHIDHPKGIEPVVIGERNWSNASNRSRRSSTPKASQNDRGKVFRSMGGENRARAMLQKGLWTKVCNHHSRQCSTVRRATPRPSRKACSRGGVIPCCIAATSTTTKPQ